MYERKVHILALPPLLYKVVGILITYCLRLATLQTTGMRMKKNTSNKCEVNREEAATITLQKVLRKQPEQWETPIQAHRQGTSKTFKGVRSTPLLASKAPSSTF